jgi:hypothetical protein
MEDMVTVMVEMIMDTAMEDTVMTADMVTVTTRGDTVTVDTPTRRVEERARSWRECFSTS